MRGIGPIHGMLGDVAERLGDRRLALEYFALGMDEAEWVGWTEVLGRLHRRIALLIVDDDPESAAVLLGAGLARSAGSRLTGRAIDARNRGIDELAAKLGADRSRELQARGAAMDDHAVGALAHTAVAHALSGDGSREPEPAPAAATKGNVFRRRGDVWTLTYEGVSIQLRDAKGLRYLSRLLAEPGRECTRPTWRQSSAAEERPPLRRAQVARCSTTQPDVRTKRVSRSWTRSAPKLRSGTIPSVWRAPKPRSMR
jgi:hypothetical protein